MPKQEDLERNRCASERYLERNFGADYRAVLHAVRMLMPSISDWADKPDMYGYPLGDNKYLLRFLGEIACDLLPMSSGRVASITPSLMREIREDRAVREAALLTVSDMYCELLKKLNL